MFGIFLAAHRLGSSITRSRPNCLLIKFCGFMVLPLSLPGSFPPLGQVVSVRHRRP
jgi:hypothetical protein